MEGSASSGSSAPRVFIWRAHYIAHAAAAHTPPPPKKNTQKSYEGLVRSGDTPHAYGVLEFPNRDRCVELLSLSRAPLRVRPQKQTTTQTKQHNRYEGQLADGHMDGYGVYVWRDGT